MRIVLREVLTRCELRKVDPRPERTGRRNITFSPRAGTPVVVESRREAREPVARLTDPAGPPAHNCDRTGTQK